MTHTNTCTIPLLSGDLFLHGEPLSEQAAFGQCAALVYVLDAQDEPYQVFFFVFLCVCVCVCSLCQYTKRYQTTKH